VRFASDNRVRFVRMSRIVGLRVMIVGVLLFVTGAGVLLLLNRILWPPAPAPAPAPDRRPKRRGSRS
jgi:hypothetical protein